MLKKLNAERGCLATFQSIYKIAADRYIDKVSCDSWTQNKSKTESLICRLK